MFAVSRRLWVSTDDKKCESGLNHVCIYHAFLFFDTYLYAFLWVLGTRPFGIGSQNQNEKGGGCLLDCYYGEGTEGERLQVGSIYDVYVYCDASHHHINEITRNAVTIRQCIKWHTQFSLVTSCTQPANYA